MHSPFLRATFDSFETSGPLLLIFPSGLKSASHFFHLGFWSSSLRLRRNFVVPLSSEMVDFTASSQWAALPL